MLEWNTSDETTDLEGEDPEENNIVPFVLIDFGELLVLS